MYSYCVQCTVVLYTTKAQAVFTDQLYTHWLAATLSIGQLCCESVRGSVTDSDENVKSVKRSSDWLDDQPS